MIKKHIVSCRLIVVFIIAIISFLLSACSPKVDRKINDLDSSTVDVRRRAAESLGDIGDLKAVDPLIHALDDEDYFMQINTTVALGKIGDPRAVNPLISLYLENDHMGRSKLEKAIEEAIIAIGEPAVKELIPKLMNVEIFESHERDDEVELASYALVKIGNPAINDLLDALEKEELRVGAAEVLKSLGYIPADETSQIWYWIGLGEEDELVKIGSSAVEPLILYLGNQDDEVRQFAIYALGEIGDSRAIDPLVEALNDSEEYTVRWSAVMALGKIDNLSAIEALITAFKDERQEVRNAAIDALAQIGEPAIEPLTEAIYSNEIGVPNNSFMALGEIGGQQVITLITDIINNPDESMTNSFYAPAALVKANDDDASVLFPFLEDESTVWVYKSLIDLGQEGTEDELIEALFKFGDQFMVNVYLNCGNSSLESAGSMWAYENGYSVVSLQGGSSSGQWGGGN